MTYTNELDATMAAKARAKENTKGFAYACEWPNHWTVEDNKPMIRHGKIIECQANGERFIA